MTSRQELYYFTAIARRLHDYEQLPGLDSDVSVVRHAAFTEGSLMWDDRAQDGGVPVSIAQEELTRSIQLQPEDSSRGGMVQGGLRLLVLLGSLLFAAGALAAPDEAALGKAEGYPICPLSARPDTRCLVSLVSRFDEVFPARKVARGTEARPLKRAAAEPVILYTYQSHGASGLDDYLSRNRTTGLLILKGDTILAERYQYDRKPEQRMASYSMAKTIVAMLVGIALSEGKIQSLDDRAERYVAELIGTPYGETPLRHLLTMSSGVRFTETYSGSDDVATLARLSLLGESDGGAATVMPFRTRDRPAGEKFHYSSAETQVLGLVLRAATGKPLAEYLSEKIWQPMGAEADASWIIDKGGYEAAYFGVNATVRDYARLGMLLANDGALDGRQIIPADWVRAATTPPAKQFEPGQTNSLYGYGYQTWILPGKERQFMLRGLRGQAVFVDPKAKLVMVHTAAGGVGEQGMGERIALWFAVVESLAK
jgi:CubicO group peptidase (beta-lactamase class C family)